MWREKAWPDVISVRGAGGPINEKGKTVRRFLGEIDPSDKELAESLINSFIKGYVNSPVENILVITADGEVHFATDNKNAGVDCSYLGDKLKGSYNIHTHPSEETQFSFSTDVDIPAAFADGTAVMDACDYKYRYRFEVPKHITFEQWDKVRYDVQDKIYAIMFEYGYDFDNIEEDREHIIILETCKRLGLDCYRRWKL